MDAKTAAHELLPEDARDAIAKGGKLLGYFIRADLGYDGIMWSTPELRYYMDPRDLVRKMMDRNYVEDDETDMFIAILTEFSSGSAYSGSGFDVYEYTVDSGAIVKVYESL